MARKVFLILAIFLLIGQLVEQTAADEGVMLSELADDSGDDRVYYEADSRMKRGARREKFKAGLKKAAKFVGKAALGVGKAALKSMG